mgnify:CR=1 FL=1
MPRVLPAAVALTASASLWALRAPPEDSVLLWVAVVAAFGAVVWALADLEQFVLVGLLAAMIFPQALLSPGGALVAAADLLLLVALGAWLARAALRGAQPLWITGNPFVVPGLAFAAVTAASVLWSLDAAASVKQAVQIAEIVVVLPLLFASVPTSLERLRHGLHAYIALTSVLAVTIAIVWLPNALSGNPAGQYLPGLHKNATGSFIGVGLVLAYSLRLSPGAPRWLGVAVAVQTLGLVATVSRGSLAGAAVAVLVVSAVVRRKRLATLALAVAASAVFVVAIQQQLSEQNRLLGGYGTNVVRVLSYTRGIDQIQERPLLGTGAGAYWDFIPELQIGLEDPNNMFILTWAELGIAGLAALLFLLWRYGRAFGRSRNLPEPARTIALAAGGGALSLFAHFQVDSTWTRGTASICFALIGVMLAAHRLAPAPALEPRSAAPRTATRVAARGLSVLQVVSSTGYAGIERHVIRLARGLRERGVDCRIACPPAAERLRAEAASAGIPVTPAGGSRRGGAWFSDVLERLTPDPPDVVHAHDGAAAVAAWRLTSGGRSRLVRTQHFVQPASAERRGLRGAVSLALHRTLNLDLAALVAVSESVSRAARSRREVAEAKLDVIPPGIDLPSVEDVEAAVRARRELSHPVVAFVGRLEEEKSLPTLIAAIPMVLRDAPECRFVIAGAGSGEHALRELAAGLGVEQAIDWLGEVPEAAPVLAGAHVFVNPGAVEGFGLVTAEAMAWQLPVVGASSGGSAELIEDGVTGLLFDPHDQSGLAGAIVRLVGDPEEAERLGAAAGKVAREQFGAERTVALTVALYERVTRR